MGESEYGERAAACREKCGFLPSLERWAKTFNVIGEGIFIIDREFRILQSNRAFAEMLGAAPEELVGRRCFELVHGTVEPPEWCVTAAALHEGKRVRGELHEPTLERHLAVSVDPSFDDEGEFEFAVHTALDITVRKTAEKSLEESEARYRMLVDTLNEGIWAIDAEGFTTFANNRMAEMLGYEVEEMHGRHLFDFMDDDGRKLAEENLERRRRGVREQHDFEFLGKDGGRFFATLETAPVLDENGEYAGAIAAVMDITARRETENRLRAAEARYRELAETLPEVVFETDLSGRITYSNHKGFELFGYTEDDLREGVNALDVIDPADHERILRAIAKMGDGRSTGATREYLAKRKDGSSFLCEAATTLITDGRGEPAGIRGILTDITQRKAAEENLRRSEETLQTIFDSIPALAFFKDRHNVLLRVNRPLSTALGMPPEEIVGRPLVEIFPDMAEDYWKDDLEVIATGEPKLGIVEPMETPPGNQMAPDRQNTLQGLRWGSSRRHRLRG